MGRMKKHSDADAALGKLPPEDAGPPKAVRRTVAKNQHNAWEQISELAARQCEELLAKHAPGIEEAYRAAIEDIDDDKKQKYTVNLGVSITGDDPDHFTVRTKISYAVKTSDSTEDQVAVGADLVDQMGGAE